MGAGSQYILVWYLTDGVSQIHTHAVNILCCWDKAEPLIIHCKMSKRMHDPNGKLEVLFFSLSHLANKSIKHLLLVEDMLLFSLQIENN